MNLLYICLYEWVRILFSHLFCFSLSLSPSISLFIFVVVVNYVHVLVCTNVSKKMGPMSQFVYVLGGKTQVLLARRYVAYIINVVNIKVEAAANEREKEKTHQKKWCGVKNVSMYVSV